MAGNENPVVEIPRELTTLEQVREFIRKTISRRDFNRTMGIAGLGAVAFQLGCGSNKQELTPRQVFVANAKGLVVADPTNCVGCRRCEAACVGFNQGKPDGTTAAQPRISNVKVNRNLLYGTTGAKGFASSFGGGLYGNFTVTANTCNQCPHPVPCQVACPNGAIEVTGDANQRVVNEAKCKGCGICVKACPWEMTSLDGPVLAAATKAHKCNLCNGAPECVAACPGGALTYVPWTDMTAVNPPRQSVPASLQVSPDIADTCKQCH
jgi:Fe-S-cluster-containing hydrogenase component 2